MLENNFEQNTNFNARELASAFVVVVTVVLVVVFGFGNKNNDKAPKDAPDPLTHTELFENLDLEASAFIVWDTTRNKEIFSKNSETQLPLASLTKVMMALTSLNHSPSGTLVAVSDKSLLEEGDSGLFSGERWKLKDLIDFSLVVSSNDAASSIASAVGSQISSENPVDTFVGLMNREAQQLGLTQTYFISPSGLDKEDIIPGGNGSVRDMAFLFDYVLENKPEIFNATSYPELTISSLDLEHEAKNTNADLLRKLPGIVASKTGFTDLAGGNLFVVFEPEPTKPIILGVLNSSIGGRFSDIEKLFLTTLDYLNK